MNWYIMAGELPAMEADETRQYPSDAVTLGIRDGELINERYRIERKLGSGGMGDVYLATDIKLERQVAVKTIRLEALTSPEKLEEQKARFEREAKTAAKLEHSNLTSVYDVGEFQGYSYLVMEYVDGVTLQQILRKQQKLGLEQAVSILNGICDGLAEAHSKQIVHRDLKPANIMIDSRNQVKVTDFGLAKPELEQDITHSGSLVGTPNYLSPEQAKGLRVDPRSDIWALGLIFHEMLTGRNLFRSGSISEVFAKILTFEPSAQHLELPDQYAFLRPVLARLLTPDREQRAADVQEVKRLVQQALASHGQAEVADATTSLTLKSDFTRLGPETSTRSRKPLLIGGAALALVVLAVFLLRPVVFPSDPLDPKTWGIGEAEAALFDRIHEAAVAYEETGIRGERYRDYDHALGKLQALVDDGVTEPVVTYFLGRCLYDKRDYAEAAAALARGEHALFRIWHVRSLLRSNQLEEAKAALEAFVRTGDAREEDVQEVRQAIATLEAGSISFDAWLRMVELQEQRVNKELQLRSLEKLASDAPSAAVEVRLAAAVFRDDPERALAHLRRALELEPGNRQALQGMYEVYYLQKDYDASLRYQMEIVDQHGADKGIAYDIACIYALKGDKKRALDWLRTALELGFKDFDHLREDADLESLRTETDYVDMLYRYDR